MLALPNIIAYGVHLVAVVAIVPIFASIFCGWEIVLILAVLWDQLSPGRFNFLRSSWALLAATWSQKRAQNMNAPFAE